MVHKIPLVKTHSRKHKKYVESKDLSKILPIVNKLQKTPWRVNREVLNVMYDVFINNMVDPKTVHSIPRCYGGIPSSTKYMATDIIPKPPSMEPEKDTKISKEEWHLWNKKRERVQIDLDAEVSRRMVFTYALNVAQKMLDYEKFWYVYQLDYRGRVYSHNEFLNPQSKSYIKAMLEFGEGRVLNDRGMYWLKIHIANCYGLDKELFSKRVRFVEENSSMLLEVARDPLSNLNAWAYTDSPYEFLSSCMAYRDALEGKEIYLPIQLDATCSGLQFYSGLLLDREGAQAVNIVGQNREDIYQKVADKVNEKLRIGDYQKRFEFTDSLGTLRSVSSYTEAKSIEGNITRSATKRNTMTVPYSVTMRGMTFQNSDYMKKCEVEGKVFWKGDPWVVNKLITDLNYRSIYEVVSGAKLGQDYLREVAGNLKEVAKWNTPLYNFPVLQPHYKKFMTKVSTPLGELAIIKRIEGVDRGKQMSGIAANYIHSIDSTLLLYCIEQMSTAIGVIHDCFLVHPNDGDEIRKHYKEGFIKIMDTRPLERFSVENDVDNEVEVPCVGTLDLAEVMDSEYIIS